MLGDIYVSIASDIISRVMKRHFEQTGGDATDEMKAVMFAQNTEVIRASLYPILSHMLEAGILELGPAAYGDGLAIMRLE
jgi:hypothetical protein